MTPHMRTMAITMACLTVNLVLWFFFNTLLTTFAKLSANKNKSRLARLVTLLSALSQKSPWKKVVMTVRKKGFGFLNFKNLAASS